MRALLFISTLLLALRLHGMDDGMASTITTSSHSDKSSHQSELIFNCSKIISSFHPALSTRILVLEKQNYIPLQTTNQTHTRKAFTGYHGGAYVSSFSPSRSSIRLNNPFPKKKKFLPPACPLIQSVGRSKKKKTITSAHSKAEAALLFLTSALRLECRRSLLLV